MIKKKKCLPDLRTSDEFWKKQRDQITIAQLAFIRHVTTQAIRKAIREGRIKATKIGKQWVIRRKDVS